MPSEERGAYRPRPCRSTSVHNETPRDPPPPLRDPRRRARHCSLPRAWRFPRGSLDWFWAELPGVVTRRRRATRTSSSADRAGPQGHGPRPRRRGRPPIAAVLEIPPVTTKAQSTALGDRAPERSRVGRGRQAARTDARKAAGRAGFPRCGWRQRPVGARRAPGSQPPGALASDRHRGVDGSLNLELRPSVGLARATGRPGGQRGNAAQSCWVVADAVLVADEERNRSVFDARLLHGPSQARSGSVVADDADEVAVSLLANRPDLPGEEVERRLVRGHADGDRGRHRRRYGSRCVRDLRLGSAP